VRNCNTNNTKTPWLGKNRFTTSASMRYQNWFQHQNMNRLLWISFKLIQVTRFAWVKVTKALERSAAARGGLLSGGTGKALQRFGQEMGSQEYTNAFNRYQAERQARLSPLQSLTGMGQSTGQQISNAGQTMAAGVGDAMGSAAAARASGYVGTANALTGGLNTYLNYQQGQNMLGAIRGGGGSSVPGWSVNNPYPT
jgi:hypothetical protein